MAAGYDRTVKTRHVMSSGRERGPWDLGERSSSRDSNLGLP